MDALRAGLWKGVVCLLSCASLGAQANDFPTADRVLYVQECLRQHPGPPFEMVHKCACVVDALARELRYDDYVTASTISKAISIGGERGSTLRDAPSLEVQARRYLALQATAKKGCFIAP